MIDGWFQADIGAGPCKKICKLTCAADIKKYCCRTLPAIVEMLCLNFEFSSSSGWWLNYGTVTASACRASSRSVQVLLAPQVAFQIWKLETETVAAASTVRAATTCQSARGCVGWLG
eukprot:g24684.t1